MAIINTKIGTLEYLAAEEISVPHCFTTRLGGVSEGFLSSMNLSASRGDSPENVAENFKILGDHLGCPRERMVLTRQTHSDIIRKVSSADCLGTNHSSYPECDGLITNEPGLGLVIFTADCTPILFHDPVTGAVGAVHAGWRGTAAQISGKAVEAMVSAYGCNRSDIRAAIGPNIGICCFETDADVPDAMVNALGDAARPFIQTRGAKYLVDLKGINRLILQQAGLRHIAVSNACTACDPHLFWSHRRMGGNRGSQGAIIICKEGAK